MSSTSSVDICGHPVPKWALIAGGAVVTGSVAYLGYKNIYASRKEIKNEKSVDKKKTNGTLANVQSTSEPKTPAEIVQELKAKGNDFFKQKKYNEAIDFYTKGILSCPSNDTKTLSALHQNRAAAHENLGDYEKVLEDSDKALSIVPNYAKAITRRAKAHENLGNLEMALQDVTACCIFENFSNQNTLMSADRVLKALGLQHAREEMGRRSFFTPSTQFIKTYLKSFPNDPVLQPDRNAASLSNGVAHDETPNFFAKGKRAFENENYPAAIQYCTEEIQSASSHDTKCLALLLRASLYIFTSQSDKALEDLHTLITDEKVDSKLKVNAYIKRAAVHLHTASDFEKAFADLDEAEKVDPEVADSYYQRGQIYCLFGKYEEALINFEKTIKLNPNFVIAQAQKCFVAHRKAVQETSSQQIEETLAEFKQMVQLHQNCAEACTLYAQILTDQQDFEGADEYFQRASKIEPQNATLYVHRALLALQARGNIDEAMKLIQKAIAIDKSCLFAYETMGTIEVQRGKLKEAVKYFDLALPLAKDEAELSHIYSLRDAAIAQMKVCERYNIKVPNL